MRRLLPATAVALLCLLAATPAALQAQESPSISFELSPGHDLPWDASLIGTITLSNLDFSSYSSVMFHADITGHEDRTSGCFGEDTAADQTVAVDESEEVFTVRLFKPCHRTPGGFGSYYYTLDLSIFRVDPGPPEQKIELATVSTAFLVTQYLTLGQTIAPPPEPGAQLWMDPDPRTLTMYVHTWRRFRFPGDVTIYSADHLGVRLSPYDHGLLVGLPDAEGPPETSPEEACRDADRLSHWRRAVHQGLWVTACRAGEAVIQLNHETDAVPPLYTSTFQTLPADGSSTPVSVGPITGGGGGGPSGPSPSKLDFEWTVTRDIDELDSGNGSPTGLWSDHTTLWIAENPDGADDAAYAYDLTSGERVEDREFELDQANRAPRGLWSDGETMWVSDSGRERLFTYDLASGGRLADRDLALASRNANARGIWSDDTTMWVLDGVKNALFAYDLASRELLAEYALNPANGDPRGIWSDGVTFWVSDDGAKKLLAYRLQGDALKRIPDEEFTELSPASNNSPRGIWSDGDVMYVADASDDKVYTYNMPDALDARLASLALSDLEIGEFKANQTDYTATLGNGVTQTTVEAAAVQRRARVATVPDDADGDDANGHQIALEGDTEITVTVTSANGSRTRVYRVAIERPVGAIALVPTWTSFQWPGANGTPIDDALRGEGSAGNDISDKVTAVYQWDEAARSWLAFFPDPELQTVPGLNTLTTLHAGREYWIATTESVTWIVAIDVAADER